MPNRNLIALLCRLFFVTLAIMSLNACEPAARQNDNDSLQYKLAVINAGGYVPKDDVTVDRFRDLLESIARKCPNSQSDIADVSVASQKIMREKGLPDTLLEVMDAIDQSIPPGSTMDVKEVAAAYVTLRTAGR